MKHLIVAVIVLSVALVGLRHHLESSRSSVVGIEQVHAVLGIPVRVDLVQRRDLQERIVLTGNVEEYLRLPAVSEVDGILVEVIPRVGDQIRRGEIVARLDDRTQRATLDSAKAQLSIAQAQLQKAERGARPQEIHIARGRRDEAADALVLAREELQRLESLVERRAASRQSLDHARGEFDMAKARFEQAKNNLSLLEEGSREEDIQKARAAVVVAERQVEIERLELERHAIRAPLSGVVKQRAVEPGELVRNAPSAMTLLEIVQLQPILVGTQVSELHVSRITRDTEVVISFDAFPGESFQGVLHEMVPAGDMSRRAFRVVYSLDNPHLRIKPGMFARVTLTLTQHRGVLSVPAYVLRDPDTIDFVDDAPDDVRPVAELDGSGRRAIVMIVVDGHAHARLVRVGVVANGWAQILEGLSEGDVVVIDGYEELRVGQKVSS